MGGLLLYDITVYPYQFIVTVYDYCLVSSHSKEGNTFSFLHCVVRYYRTCDEKTITSTNFCKTWFVSQGFPHLEMRYIFLLLTPLTASGVVIYLMMLPTDYLMPHGKVTGKRWIEKLWKSGHGLIKTLSWNLPRGINEKQTEPLNGW